MHTLIVDDEPLARGELRYLLEKCDEITSISEADSVQDALSEILKQKPDLLFLDIHLTDESGLTLAEKVLQMKQPPLIIFATAYDEHAIQAFELNAIDYVLKPFEQPRIEQAVKRAANYFHRLKTDQQTDRPKIMDTIPIQMEDRIYIVKIDQIIVMGVLDGETTIHTNDRAYTTKEPLSTYEKRLRSDDFIRVHRSYIINQKYIKEIEPWFNHTYQVTMTNDLKIPVSRSYIKEFREKIGI
ncbi:LytTR family transcriptional regulator DNA-binding domain-containing protein [Bavariicoccus seileri]|uniref:LytTR family transcriptional regulator DNA-binding domain-containing protein n=1 Tax=Bavariicoccus seileri TaxID=549685 RepID=UPI0003B6E191|nr:LytTR family transcriptional regulator DNA-binding domain-containing protein [Bavariicoccus seileri]